MSTGLAREFSEEIQRLTRELDALKMALVLQDEEMGKAVGHAAFPFELVKVRIEQPPYVLGNVLKLREGLARELLSVMMARSFIRVTTNPDPTKPLLFQTEVSLWTHKR